LQIRVLQHAEIDVAADVAVLLQHHAILGERASLVGAEHVHRAQVLDRIEALDDDLLLGHRDSALRQIGRDHHREHFGREADRDRDREQKGLLVTAFTPRSKLVRVRWPSTLFAREPNTVWLPVWTKTAVADPLMTVVPMKHRLVWSNGLALVVGARSADFSTPPASVLANSMVAGQIGSTNNFRQVVKQAYLDNLTTQPPVHL
jgi:hypothetical protein